MDAERNLALQWVLDDYREDSSIPYDHYLAFAPHEHKVDQPSAWVIFLTKRSDSGGYLASHHAYKRISRLRLVALVIIFGVWFGSFIVAYLLLSDVSDFARPFAALAAALVVVLIVVGKLNQAFHSHFAKNYIWITFPDDLAQGVVALRKADGHG